MTMKEASKRYSIPIEILYEYESWGMCTSVKKEMGVWQYDDFDLERLSLIMTLYDVGFSNDEVKTYMCLLLEGDVTERQRLNMLNKKRSMVLDEIHLKEEQLDCLDYLRHKIHAA